MLHCNTMETISIRFQEDIIKNMDKSIAKNNFNSRTEFIREAVRDKLSDLTKEVRIKAFMKYYVSIKNKTTWAEQERIRHKVGEEFRRKFRGV